jgi:hypothetical protein
MKAAILFRIILFMLIINVGSGNETILAQVANASSNNEPSPAISSAITKENRLPKKEAQKLEQLQDRFQCFGALTTSASYTITLCADLPDNDHPNEVHVKNEPGHVFIILSKKDSSSSCSIAFGFYPRKPLSSLLFKKVRSKILESHSREYEVSISRAISAAEFQLIEQKAIEVSIKKYDLAHYNCYDYALEIFNSIPNIEKLPVHRIKFPFPFGRGGSPCGLYHDLQELKKQSGFWREAIQFGHFKSPSNCKN